MATEYGWFKDAYNVRSAVVHGDRPRYPEGLSENQFADALEDRARRLIARAIELARKKELPTKLAEWAKFVIMRREPGI